MRTRTQGKKTAASVILSMLVIACGDETTDVKRPLDPPGRDTQGTYQIRPMSGGEVPAEVRFVGEVPFNGQSWEKYEVTYPGTSGTKVIHFFGFQSEGRRIVVAGGDVNYPPEDTTHRNYVVTLDDPLTVDLDAVPIGEPQTTTASGKFVISGLPEIRASAVARWTKSRTDAVVETKLGTVAGVEMYEGEVELTEGEGHWLLDAVKGMTIRGTVWMHPTMGLLKAETPDFPIGASLQGSHSCGDPSSGSWNTIQAVGVVAPGQPPFVLSTFECSGEFDADKMRHAKMLLELRFADDEKARTPQTPPVEVSFNTALGWFPFQLVSSPVSIFHPEENGQGYTFWYAYVDQGAKNESGDNGIMYEIEVQPTDYQTSPVRAAARIHYGIYRP